MKKYGICLFCLFLVLMAPLAAAQDSDDFEKSRQEVQKNLERLNELTKESAGAFAACGVLFLFLFLAHLVLVIVLMVWVAKDAKARGESPALWVIVQFFLGIIGLIIWLLARPKGALVICPSCQNKRLDAIKQCPHCGHE